MRILQIVNRVPYPLNDGGSIGIHYYLEGYLDAGAELSMLLMNTSRDYVDVTSLPAIYQRLKHLKVVDINTDIQVLAAIKNILFEKTSYNVQRFNQEKVHQVLIKMLKEEDYDIIHLDSLFVTDYIPTIRQYSKAKIVIRQHNVEYKIWERLAEDSNNILKKWYYNFLAKRLKQHELSCIQSYDLTLAISQNDQSVFETLYPEIPILLHPFGIRIQEEDLNPVLQDGEDLKIYHIGAMDWRPNQDSVRYLLEDIAPQALKEIEGISFHIAGRYMGEEWFKYAQEGIEIYGEVPSAEDFERDKDVLIVPLKSGAGVRIKIFQAMAAGKIVVTSPIGLEGIEAEHQKEVMIVESTADYIQAIKWLKEHPLEAKQIAENARQLIREKYNAQDNFEKLMSFYEQL